MTDYNDIPVEDDGIKLGQFLKLADLVESGSEAKQVLAGGVVRVNGDVETRRGRQLERGDVVSLGANSARVGGERDWGDLLGQPTLEQVDHEDQRLAGLDHPAGAAVAVAQVRRDHELPAAADLHALHAGVPALDDLADAEPELQRLAPVVRRVELLAASSGPRPRSAPTRCCRTPPRRRRRPSGR